MAEKARNVLPPTGLTDLEKRQLSKELSNASLASATDAPAWIARKVREGHVRFTKDILDLLKLRYASEPDADELVTLASDYRISKILDVSTSTVSK